MSNNKNSSLDWLIEEINKQKAWADPSKLEPIIQQAKAMHEKEIKDAVGVGSQFDRDYLYGYHDKAEQYYNETFGGTDE